MSLWARGLLLLRAYSFSPSPAHLHPLPTRRLNAKICNFSALVDVLASVFLVIGLHNLLLLLKDRLLLALLMIGHRNGWAGCWCN
ncbi:hypothetical protein BDV09DRAFT_164022 [Aspergillus tetrazonus]